MAWGPYVPSLRSLDNDQAVDLHPANVNKHRHKRPSVHAPTPNNGRKSKKQPQYPDWWDEMTEREQKLYLIQHPHSKHRTANFNKQPVYSPHTERKRPDAYLDHKVRLTDSPYADPEQDELMQQLHNLAPKDRKKVEHDAEQVVHSFKNLSSEDIFSLVNKALTPKNKDDFDELLHLRRQVDNGQAFDAEDLEPASATHSILPKRAKHLLKKFLLLTMLAAGGGLLVVSGGHAAMVAAVALHHLKHEHGVDMVGPVWEKLRRKSDIEDSDNLAYANSRRQTSMHKLIEWMKNSFQSNRVKDDELTAYLRKFKYR